MKIYSGLKNVLNVCPDVRKNPIGNFFRYEFVLTTKEATAVNTHIQRIIQSFNSVYEFCVSVMF